MNRRNQTTLYTIAALIIVAVIYIISSSKNAPSAAPANTGASTTQSSSNEAVVVAKGPHTWGKQTKTSGCKANNGLPDSGCTPGDVMETDVKKICQQGYAGSVRNVPDSEKNQVYSEYGIASHTPGQYEVDHLVSLELGGSNDISNLWPELAEPRPGFHDKDKVENYMHDQVCAGKISLQDAQVQIATNWLAIYNSMPK